MIREMFCHITGYRYNYRCNMKYLTKEFRVVIEVNVTVSTTSPRFIDRHRDVKKECSRLLMRHVPKRHLCNGRIAFEPITYLGLWCNK